MRASSPADPGDSGLSPMPHGPHGLYAFVAVLHDLTVGREASGIFPYTRSGAVTLRKLVSEGSQWTRVAHSAYHGESGALERDLDYAS